MIGRQFPSFYERLQELSLEFPPKRDTEGGDPSTSDPVANQRMQQTTQSPAVTLQDNIPMGDPMDTIAQMLKLNLSVAASPEQRNQVVISAVEGLVNKLHELSGMPESDDQMSGEDQMYDDGSGDDGEEESDDEEYEDEDEDDGSDDEEYEDDGSDDEEYEDENEEEEEPPRNGFAASHDIATNGKALQALQKYRTGTISNLVQSGHLIPASAEKMVRKYVSTESLGLSLSMDTDQPDDFDEQVEMLLANGPVISYQEKTSSQTGLQRMSEQGLLELSAADLQTNKNPMVAEAERRAAEAAKAKV